MNNLNAAAENTEETKKLKTTSIVLGLGLVALAIISRLVPHPWNFTAIGATGLFAGYFAGSGISRFEKLGFLALPFVGLFLSDWILGFHSIMVYTYFGLAFSVILGRLSGTNSDWPKWLEWTGQSFISSTLFYMVTNFGVWFTGGLYPRSFDGLMQSFVAGIPFYGYQVAGDLFYLSAIILVCIYFRVPQRRMIARQNILVENGLSC
ncbi:MAG: DUF6580 family putative transport protein [Bdellovibrionota bacterium]